MTNAVALETNPDSTKLKRAASSLRCLFVADAISMPVHWYYRRADIFSQFPQGITKFEDAPALHPGSIMSLHSTFGGGRKRSARQGKSNEVIGTIILKDKAQYWGEPNVHYHRGMSAGENTLNAHCARVLMRTIASSKGKYDENEFLTAYVKFMTSDTPLHPDTYAESYHREFFSNLATGLPPNKCGGATHDTASIGGLVTVAPLAISLTLNGLNLSETQELTRSHLRLTHPDTDLYRICDAFVELLRALMLKKEDDNPDSLIESIALKSIGESMIKIVDSGVPDEVIVGRKYSPACYISDSWPSVLYLALKYHADPLKGLLVNANLGGDNVHRGSILGAILGLMGESHANTLFQKLTDSQILENEIANLCKIYA